MKKHKRSLIFLGKFFVTYFLLFAIYSSYLRFTQQKTTVYQTAGITTKTADLTVTILDFLGYQSHAKQHAAELSVKIFINNTYVSRVIEGCNSVSIIILFIAFIVAFSGSLKATVLYAVWGSFLIYVINILRIAFLSVMLYKYPAEQEILHNIIFPAIIYGFTFLLWVIWVHKFSKLKTNE